MATKTEKDTLIQCDEESKDEKDESSVPTIQPKCYCSEYMVKTKGNEGECIACKFNWNKEEYNYQCPNNSKQHRVYFCVECAKYINPNPLKYDSCNLSKLYFVYNNNKVYGPLTVEEIMKMYIMSKYVTNRLYVKPVFHMGLFYGSDSLNKRNFNWMKIEIPMYDDKYLRYKPNDKRRCNLLKEYEKINSDVKQTYPDLYENLVENVFFGKLRSIPIFPTDIPQQETTTLFKRFIQILGKILEIIMVFIVLLHCLPTFVAFGCCACCVGVYMDGNEEKYSEAQHRAVFDLLLLIIYSGMIIVPILVVYFLLSATETYRIQSWMIAYILWGIFAFIVLAIYCVINVYQHKADTSVKAEKALIIMNNMLFLIIGVEFGERGEVYWGLHKLTLLVFPPFASFLPAAIGGFIANYILEEKFILNCSQDIVNNDLCYQDGRGCCEIISSRDIENSYAFIGGLASNIIATWAVLRVCGYLLVNAHSNIALYAKRRAYQ